MSSKTNTHNSPESSQIAMASYNYDRKVLTVVFNSGSSYEYSGVPEEIWNQYRQAESVGKFLNQNIKGFYNYQKV